MKTGRLFRHSWKVEGNYVPPIHKDDADELAGSIERGDWSNANTPIFKKTVKRYFEWLEDEKVTDYTDGTGRSKSLKRSAHDGTTSVAMSSVDATTRLSPTDL